MDYVKENLRNELERSNISETTLNAMFHFPRELFIPFRG